MNKITINQLNHISISFSKMLNYFENKKISIIFSDDKRYSYIYYNERNNYKLKNNKLIINDQMTNHNWETYMNDLYENSKIEINNYDHYLFGLIGYFSFDVKEIKSIKKDKYDYQFNFSTYKECLIYDNENENWSHMTNTSNIFNINLDKENIKDIHKYEYNEHCNITKKEYKEAFKEIQKDMMLGKYYVLNFAIHYKNNKILNPLSIFKKLRKINSNEFNAFYNDGEVEIICNSMERFITINNNILYSEPIKGTISINENVNLLKESIKENEELLMITDLMRNDISIISENKSVETPLLNNIKKYNNLYHKSSLIKSKIYFDKPFTTLLKILPSASITGAPKLEVVKAIYKYENYNRDYYTGNFGFIGFDRKVNLNVIIRTIKNTPSHSSYSIGSGITLKSNAEEEWDELLLKKKNIEKVLKGEI